MTPSHPVYVVDDDQSILNAVRCLLLCDKHEVHCYSSAREFLEHITPEQVGCLITDLRMPDMDGLQLQERLVAMNSMLSIIILTGRADVGSTVRLMKNGAATLLEKPYPPETLLQEVRQSLALSEKRAERQRIRVAARKQLALLDEDEREVIGLAAEGMPNKAIAQRLALSSRTVDRRRQSAQLKLNISSPAGYTRLLAQASDEGLPEPDSAQEQPLDDRTDLGNGPPANG